MRIWFKTYKNARIEKSETVEIYSEDTRTHKIFQAIEQMTYLFDLSTPIWLDANVRDFQKRSRTRFYQDNFVEEISFDYLEMQVLEEDW